MTKTVKAVVYCRVSTDDQVENGTSLEMQDIAGTSLVMKELNGDVVAIKRDEGLSGAKYDRPGLQAALAMIESGAANVLVAYDITRLSRDTEHQQRIKKRVQNAGGRLAFCKGSFDNTEEGDLAFGIMGNFAEYERRLFRRRSMNGKRERAKQGSQPCRTHSPYGYYIVNKSDVMDGRHTKDLLGRYLVVEEQAKWVREIFAQYAEHGCLMRIVRWLRKQNAPTSKGGKWLPGTLRSILSKSVYKGSAVYGRHQSVTVENRHSRLDSTRKVKDTYYKIAPEDNWTLIDAPVIVEEAIWNVCQERLKVSQAEKQALVGGNPKTKYMLVGMVRCPLCCRRMSGHRQNHGNAYYVCRNIDCPQIRRNCYTNSKAERLESLTVEAMVRLVEEPQIVPNAIRAFEDFKKGQSADDLDAKCLGLESELGRLEARERKVADAQVDALIKGRSTDVYDRVLDEIDVEKKEVIARLAELAPRKSAIRSETLEETVKPLEKVLEAMRKVLTATTEDLSPAEKQALLTVIIDRIVPNDDGIEIELKKLMGTLYKVNVTFQGTATLEIEADSVEAARAAAVELTPMDLARQGHADILTFKVAAREVTPVSALGGHNDEAVAEAGPQKPRPSGWYRPR